MCEDDTPSDNFLSYARSWIDRVNRDGLFMVSDMAYLLFEQIEFELRKHYSTTELSTSVISSPQEVARLMSESEDVQF